MEEIVHKKSALKHLEIANSVDNEILKEKEEKTKAALRTVAAQNFFYAGINAIETIFAKRGFHSFSHQNRHEKIISNPGIISSRLFGIFDEVDRDLRNKVGYRGKNGKDYQKIKSFALLAVKEMEK